VTISSTAMLATTNGQTPLMIVMDDWMLYAQDSPSTSGARGLNRGGLYTRDGMLIASVAQEGLIRQRRKD